MRHRLTTMIGSAKVADTTKEEATGTGITSLNEPSKWLVKEVAPLKSENWCHFYVGVVAIGCKKPVFRCLRSVEGYANFLMVDESEELWSCICCGHATRKTDQLGETCSAFFLELLDLAALIKRLKYFLGVIHEKEPTVASSCGQCSRNDKHCHCSDVH